MENIVESLRNILRPLKLTPKDNQLIEKQGVRVWDTGQGIKVEAWARIQETDGEVLCPRLSFHLDEDSLSAGNLLIPLVNRLYLSVEKLGGLGTERAAA